jgi:hypothetical protein
MYNDNQLKEVKHMRTALLFSVVCLNILLLVACDDKQPKDMAVGTVLPGGYIVTERAAFSQISDCVSHANTQLQHLNGNRVTENRQDSNTWIATAEYRSGQLIQTCIKNNSKSIMYTEAKKEQ